MLRALLLAFALLPLALLLPAPAAQAGGCVHGTVGVGPLTLAEYQMPNAGGPPGPYVCIIGATLYKCGVATYPVTYIRCEPWIVLP
jgi:hypothetical protein